MYVQKLDLKEEREEEGKGTWAMNSWESAVKARGGGGIKDLIYSCRSLFSLALHANVQ